MTGSPHIPVSHQTRPARERRNGQYKRWGLVLVFIWFSAGGLAHFIVPEFFLKIVPSSLPLRRETVYVSGFFELMGAILLLWPRWAGIGLNALTRSSHAHQHLHVVPLPSFSASAENSIAPASGSASDTDCAHPVGHQACSKKLRVKRDDAWSMHEATCQDAP